MSVKGISQDTTKCKVIQKEGEEITKMPSFPGGDEAFYTYLEKNVKLPTGFDGMKYLKEHKNEFVPISVGFTVDVDGSITNVRVLEKGSNELLDKKATEIIENMPKWEPGTMDGAAVKVDYVIPVRFNLKNK